MGRNGSSQRKVEDKTSSTDTRRARARERRARERRRRLRKRELSRKVRMGAGGDQTTMVTIKVNHGERSGPEDLDGTYKVDVSPEDSIRALKERISEVISKRAIDAELIQLSFGPSEKLIGKRFYKDPLIDEEDTFVKQYSFLEWIERFPHWGLTVKKAAASAEAMDPEKAVEEAYKTGELLRPEELPAPWGDKGLDVYKRDPLVRSIGDNPLPPNYGDSKPSSTRVKAGKAGWEASDVDHIPNVLDLE